jgi:hypothetical protein
MQLSMRCFRAGEKRELEETAWHQLLGEVCFWPLADISIALPNVRYCGSKAEVTFCSTYVRFWPKADVG